MPAVWIELRLDADASLADTYAKVDKFRPASIHHFNYEPWHEIGSVVRVLLADDEEAWECVRAVRDSLDSWGWWDAKSDEKLFGDKWPQVRNFFEASSRLAITDPTAWELQKVTHCHLNAHGLDVLDEIKWGRKFLQGRRWAKRGCKKVWWRRALLKVAGE